MGRIIHGGLRVNAIDKPLEWAVGFFFGNTELNLRLHIIVDGTQLVPLYWGYWWGSGNASYSNSATTSYFHLRTWSHRTVTTCSLSSTTW